MVKIRQSFWTLLLCATLMAEAALAQSSLTPIIDTVLNADGTPFNGTVVITWNGLTGTAGGTISPLSTTARIYNGALSVLLVPTSTASSGTYYQASYNSSDGLVTWVETWQVPVSTTPLTISAIRTSTTQGATSGGGTGGTGGTGTTGGTQYAVLPITVGEVTGLSGNLASINASVASLASQLTTVSSASSSNSSSITSITTSLNSLTSSLAALTTTVNSLTSASGTTASFVDSEAPAGVANGTNAAFNLSQTPSPAGSLTLYRNGLVQTSGVDFAMSGTAVTFLPGSVPRSGDVIAAFYRVPGTGASASFTDAEVPGGAASNSNLTFTLANAPKPAASLKLYKNGVLLTQNSDYTLSGSTITFANTTVTPQLGDSLLASYRH